MLTLSEVNARIVDPKVVGNEAAAALLIRREIDDLKTNTTNCITRGELISRAQDARWRAGFFRTRDQIWNVNRTVGRTLFMPGDPGLDSFHQGGIGDCYLMALLGAFVSREPRTVRSMVVHSGSLYRVRFPNGRETMVSPLTDAEAMSGAFTGGNHGVWLTVLEKAYAVVSREDLEAASRASIDPTATVKDLIGSSTHRDPYQGVVVHRSAVSIIPLLTGHACLVTNFSNAEADPGQTAAAAAHSLLGLLKRERRLVEVSDSPGLPRPKALPGGHAYAMLDYDAGSRTVTLFNPWGNNFTPENPPGLDNGYLTRNGTFQLPLDHFLKLFHHICYETSEPALAR